MQQLTTRSWRRIKSVSTRARQIVFPPAPRAANDYATHVPVLIGLARLRRIERVLEFGCGHYSTNTFLDAAAFPHLKQLLSVENDPAWAETIGSEDNGDSRFCLHVVSGAMCDIVSALDFEEFDLVLVDDSTSAEQRISTIRALTSIHPLNPWVVIHDYEIAEYRAAACGFKQRFAFKPYSPETGLVANFASFPMSRLKRLDQCLKANSSRLEPDDISGWIHALHG